MYMSGKELKFARGYEKLYEKHMYTTVLQHLPETVLDDQPGLDFNLRKLDDARQNMIDGPKEGGYVLGRCLRNGVEWQGEGDWEDYKKGNMILAIFGDVKPMVVNGDIELCP